MTAPDLLILLNLLILESLLSIDNAAVLAVMVKDLPPSQQPKALKYGIAGAFVFRGISLFVASWLIKILWLKIAGGLYLIYLVYNHFKPKESETRPRIENTKGIASIKNAIGAFWSTVILVEVMDITFSIDNIFAAVALTSNFTLIIVGVCIGIVAMRFAAQWFTVLMRKYPDLENAAFTVIGLLGIRLVVSGIADYAPSMEVVQTVMSAHWFDFVFCGITLLTFMAPIAKKHLSL